MAFEIFNCNKSKIESASSFFPPGEAREVSREGWMTETARSETRRETEKQASDAIVCTHSLGNNCWRRSVIESIGIIAFARLPRRRARTNCPTFWNTNERVLVTGGYTRPNRWRNVSKEQRRKEKWGREGSSGSWTYYATQHFYPS